MRGLLAGYPRKTEAKKYIPGLAAVPSCTQVIIIISTYCFFFFFFNATK